jgi:hypothetical protein
MAKIEIEGMERGNVHIIRNTLRGGGGWRFVTKPCKDIGICTVFCYKALKIRKIVLRIMWMFPENKWRSDDGMRFVMSYIYIFIAAGIVSHCIQL